jgi:hypothetical protein
VYTNATKPLVGIAHPFAETFHFVDDPAEDDMFEAFVQRVASITAAVSRPSWSGPTLSAGGISVPLVSGQYWRYAGSIAAPLYVAPADMNVVWECDQYGRAFDISKLVVP